MKFRLILVVLLDLIIFTFVAFSQSPHVISPTTAESTQIMLDVSGYPEVIKVLVSSSDVKRGKRVADYSATGKIFTVDVSLAPDDNEFLLECYNKDGKYIKTIPVTITKVAIGGKPGSTSLPTPAKIVAADTRIAEPLKSALIETEVGKHSTGGDSKITFSEPTTIAASYLSQPQTATSVPASKILSSTPPSSTSSKPTKKPDSCVDDIDNCKLSDPTMRLIFGFEQVGASSTTSKGQPFIDFFTEIPLLKQPSLNKKQEWTRFTPSFFTSLRIASTPNQALPDFGNLTTAATTGFFGTNQASKVNELIQSFQVRAGMELAMGKGFGFVAGVGATSPFSPEATVSAYTIPKVTNCTSPPCDATSAFKDVFGRDQDFSRLNTLILTSGDRDRFLRNWFFGGRLSRSFSKEPDVYPGVFELTFGEDEAITNKMRGVILKFDSLVPIPVNGLKFLYFGTSFTSRLGHARTVTPLFLAPVSNPNLSATDNFVRSFRDVPKLISGRDGFSFRFGIDLIQLLKKNSDKTPTEGKPF